MLDTQTTPGLIICFTSVPLGVMRPFRFQPHPHVFQQGWIHAYCGKENLTKVSQQQELERYWSSTGFLGTVCSHVIQHFILPRSLQFFIGDYLLVRKMQHLPKNLWAPIQTSNIHSSGKWRALRTAKKQSLLMKASKVLKSSLRNTVGSI